jgi:dihydropteroate synthase
MIRRKLFRLKLPSRTLVLGKRTLIMGVLNVTPDSFSDGSKFYNEEHAIEHALQMERAGADLIDLGAESTRPGSEGISAEEEWRRLFPVLSGLRRLLKIPVSIDTQKAEVAETALDAGAEIINDISGLKSDPRIAEVAARHRVPLILMHMRGEPRTMQKGPFARDVMKDILEGLRRSVSIAGKAGVAKSQRLPQLAKLGFPLLVGTSRKGFLGATLARDGRPAPPEERIWGTAATVTASILNGAHIIRVHDVAEMAQVACVADCVLDPKLAPRN